MARTVECVARPEESEQKAQEKITFRKVIRSSKEEVFPLVGRLILIGFVLGYILIMIGTIFSPEMGGQVAANAPWWKKAAMYALPPLFKEVGTALIVSATAIYGYELVAHVSGFVAKEKLMTDQIAVLNRSNELLSRVVDWRSAMKNDLIRLCNHEQLVERLIQPIEHAKNIHARQQHEHQWLYLNFLCELMETSVIPVANALDHFQDNIVNRRNARVEQYTTPDSRVVAGQMLTLLLRCLSSRDCYRSVSNVLFYEDTLMEMFERECQAACAKGVRVRRLFNVYNFEERIPSPELFKKSKEIIEAHYALSRRIDTDYGRGLYQFRFFGEQLLEFVRIQYDHSYHEHLDRLPKSYFGLFSNTDSKTALLFMVLESERASRVGLAFRDDTDRTDEYFDAMWEAAAFAPNPFAGNSFDSNWLDSTVGKLRTARGPVGSVGPMGPVGPVGSE